MGNSDDTESGGQVAQGLSDHMLLSMGGIDK